MDGLIVNVNYSPFLFIVTPLEALQRALWVTRPHVESHYHKLLLIIEVIML